MDRKEFFKGLFSIGAVSLLPLDNVLKATDWVEKKASPKFNHVTILKRKTVSVGTHAMSNVVWYEYDGNRIGVVPNPMFDEI